MLLFDRQLEQTVYFVIDVEPLVDPILRGHPFNIERHLKCLDKRKKTLSAAVSLLYSDPPDARNVPPGESLRWVRSLAKNHNLGVQKDATPCDDWIVKTMGQTLNIICTCVCICLFIYLLFIFTVLTVLLLFFPILPFLYSDIVNHIVRYTKRWYVHILVTHSQLWGATTTGLPAR